MFAFEKYSDFETRVSDQCSGLPVASVADSTLVCGPCMSKSVAIVCVC